jgi:hypothetical protein
LHDKAALPWRRWWWTWRRRWRRRP